MSKKPDDTPDARAGGHLLAKDEMYKVTRYEGMLPARTDPLFGYSVKKAVRLAELEAWFVLQNWPSFEERIVVDPAGGNSWGPLPKELIEELIHAGPDRLNLPGRPDTGLNFIKRSVDPLSREFWLATEAGLIIDLLDAQDGDDKLRAAEALGEHRVSCD